MPKTIVLGEAPWQNIKPPWPRLGMPYDRYVKVELGYALCRSGYSCVECPCPVDDADAGEHTVTMCVRRCEDDPIVVIKCPEHRSAEVVEAILAQIRSGGDD